MSDNNTNTTAPAVDAAAPTQLFQIVVNYSDTGNKLIDKTLKELNKYGHSNPNLHSKIKKSLMEAVHIIHVAMAKKVVEENGTKYLCFTVLKQDEQLWKVTGVYLILLGNKKKVGAAFSKSKCFYGRIMEQFDEVEQELEDDNAFVCLTLAEMLQLSNENSNLKEKVMALMEICPAFSGFYDDIEGQNRDKLFEHCLIAVFESYFAFVVRDNDPGYIAERLLKFGSDVIWSYLKMPSPELNKDAIEWLSTHAKDLQVYVLETWEPYISAIRAYIREKGMSSNDEVMAMLQDDLYQWYLNRHTLFSIWGDGGPIRSGTCLLGEEPFPDAVSCPIFADVENVAGSILQVMDEHHNGEISPNEAKSRFKSLLSGITTKHTKAYVEPTSEALRKGGQKMLTSMIEEIKEQPRETALLTTEQFLVDKFSDEYRKEIFCHAETCDVVTVMEDDEGGPTTAGTLYKIPLDGKCCKTLLIYVGCSPHITLGHGNTMPQRLSQASKQIATSSVLEEAGLINEGSTTNLIERFRFFFINVEGMFGCIFDDDPDSNRETQFYFSLKLTLPPGYYIQQIRKGVVALANEIFPGMLKHHAIALMVVMGYENFRNFLRLHCGLDLGPATNLKEKLEDMRKQRYTQQIKQRKKLMRLASAEILKILQKKVEERTEEDFENLEECRTLIYSSHQSKTSQLYHDATMLIMLLDEDSTDADYAEVAEGVRKILTDHVNRGEDEIARTLRRFYRDVAVDFEQTVIGRLNSATVNIRRRVQFGGEANAIQMGSESDDDDNPFGLPSADVGEMIDFDSILDN
eukprot:scaffold11527_cov105-Skeletonema_dohrnii-CCMP3373.AAC.9